MSVLGKKSPAAANTDVLLYSVPVGQQAIVNVNLCNRGTLSLKARLAVVDNADLAVLGITMTNKGSACTVIPTLSVNGANTTQATAVVSSMSLVGAAINAAGSGYTANDVLTVTVAGSTASAQASITVNTVNGTGGITGATVTGGGVFTALGTGTATVTGGTGVGGTFNTLTYGINTVAISNGGNGYAATATITPSAGVGAVFNVQMAQTVEAEDYLEFDTPIAASGVTERTGISLGAGQSLFVRTDNTTLNAHAWGFQELA